MSDTNEFQQVMLDNDERRLIDAFRRVRKNEFADVMLKIHRKKLVAIYVTDKWHADGDNKLREVSE